MSWLCNGLAGMSTCCYLYVARGLWYISTLTIFSFKQFAKTYFFFKTTKQCVHVLQYGLILHSS